MDDIMVTEANEFAARYVAAWNEADPALRRKRVAELWADDARYCSARAEFVGHEAIVGAVTASHERSFGEGYRFRTAGHAERHHHGVRFSWDMVPTGGREPAIIGSEFVILGEDGRILHDYQFIDKPIGQ